MTQSALKYLHQMARKGFGWEDLVIASEDMLGGPLSRYDAKRIVWAEQSR